MSQAQGSRCSEESTRGGEGTKGSVAFEDEESLSLSAVVVIAIDYQS